MHFLEVILLNRIQTVSNITRRGGTNIKAISAPGYTLGQIVLNIISGGEQLLYTSDLILHPLHLLEPQWCAALDLIPEIVAQTRRQILQKAALEKLLVMAFHFPFPGLGHVVVKGAAWAWVPIL